MIPYHCTEIEFNRVCQDLMLFGQKTHERIAFDANNLPSTHAKPNWLSRVVRYLKRLFSCDKTHPAEVVARRILLFFQANEKWTKPEHFSVLSKMEKIRNVSDIAQLQLNQLFNKYSQNFSEKLSEVDREKKLAGNLIAEAKKKEDQIIENALKISSELIEKTVAESEKIKGEAENNKKQANDLATKAKKKEIEIIDNASIASAELIEKAVAESEKIKAEAERQGVKIKADSKMEAFDIRAAAEKYKATLIEATDEEMQKKRVEYEKKLKQNPIPVDETLPTLVNDKDTMDVIITCSDLEEVKAHRLVLGTISYFKNALMKCWKSQNIESDMKDLASVTRFDFSEFDFTSETIKAFVFFLYTHEYKHKSIQQWLELYRFATFVCDESLINTLEKVFGRDILKSDPFLYFDILPNLPKKHPVVKFLLESLQIFSRSNISLSDVPKGVLDRFCTWAKEYELPENQRILEQDLVPYLTLADLYIGLFKSESDEKKVNAFIEAAAKGNYIPALSRMGFRYINKLMGIDLDPQVRIKKGKEYLEEGMKNHCPMAMLYTAECYFYGMGFDKDAEKAEQIYAKLAQKAYFPLAISRMGFFCENSTNIVRKVEALRLYEDAACYGHLDSLANLGFMLLFLPEFPNVSEGLKCITRAALKGEKRAQNILGEIYENGDFGKEKDLNQAVIWYRKAAKQGSQQAIDSLNRLKVPLEP